RAAETIGMKILAKNIGDLKENFTRFIVIGEKEAPPTGNDKTSIIFSAPNVPGALYKALESFAKRNINLSRIESRPTRKAPWQYVFFLDFEGHVSEPPCREAVAELERLCPFLRVLGSYPKAR
ncbi:MAG: prephenate dehydratase, partial [Candidatus Bathyarchaeia archaeon]